MATSCEHCNGKLTLGILHRGRLVLGNDGDDEDGGVAHDSHSSGAISFEVRRNGVDWDGLVRPSRVAVQESLNRASLGRGRSTLYRGRGAEDEGQGGGGGRAHLAESTSGAGSVEQKEGKREGDAKADCGRLDQEENDEDEGATRCKVSTLLTTCDRRALKAKLNETGERWLGETTSGGA